MTSFVCASCKNIFFFFCKLHSHCSITLVFFPTYFRFFPILITHHSLLTTHYLPSKQPIQLRIHHADDLSEVFNFLGEAVVIHVDDQEGALLVAVDPFIVVFVEAF